MAHLIVKDNSDRSPVQFIHYKPEQMSPSQKAFSFEGNPEDPPNVKPYQVARLYGNINNETYWWEVERKPKLSKYEFWSAIPKQHRIDMKEDWELDDPELADALFMLDLQDEVDMESDEVKLILDVLEEKTGFYF